MNEWNDLLKPEILWAVAGLIMLLAEFVIPGLIIFFFGLGALVVAAVCFFSDISLNAQLAVFLVASVAMLMGLRRWAHGVFMGHTSDEQDEDRNLKAYIGATAVVTERLVPKRHGKVELNGAQWKAEAEIEVEEGVEVEVVDQDGLTLKVKPR